MTPDCSFTSFIPSTAKSVEEKCKWTRTVRITEIVMLCSSEILTGLYDATLHWKAHSLAVSTQFKSVKKEGSHISEYVRGRTTHSNYKHIKLIQLFYLHNI